MTTTTEISNTETARLLLRDAEELEGTLLLPVATPIGPAITPLSSSTLAAVPTNEFDYDTAIAAELAQATATTAPPLQEAISIPQYGQQQQQHLSCADDSTPRVKSAQHTGLIMADQEMEAIERANRRSKGLLYLSNQEIQLANQLGKERDRQEREQLSAAARRTPKDAAYVDRTMIYDDMEMSRVVSAVPPKTEMEQHRSDPPKQQQQQKDDPKQEGQKEGQGGYKVGGYQVQEYSFSTSNYETGDYQFSDYKSVYD